MMLEAAVSVPGKAILLGEHAAVYGHPALVTAVDLRLTVTARARGKAGVTVTRPAEFHSGRLSPAEIADLRRGIGAPGGRLAYLAAGVALDAASAPAETGIELAIASEIPPGSGLGSSAALAVSVIAAVFAALRTPADAATIARAAKEVETRQHGRPSGVDVEAVLRGGTLWCQRDPEGELVCTPVRPALGSLAPLELYHAGTPAESTGEMVAAVARRREEDPAGVARAMSAIAEATREAREVIARSPDAETRARLISLVARAEAALEALGVVPASVAAAIREIEAAGGGAKISGAGGRAGGAGLVLVVPHESGAPVPPAWTRLACTLGASGLREDVTA
jgi:mevalonate kinase